MLRNIKSGPPNEILSGERVNNFNLIRLSCASAVLLVHTYALLQDSGHRSGAVYRLCEVFSAYAVDIFFIISGYLITASATRSGSVWQFVLARLLRIYPALFVAIFLTVLMAAYSSASMSLSDFVFRPQILKYVAKCGTLLFGVEHQLEGAFQANPWPGVVNGSLWTLPHEIRAYLFTLVIWVLARAISAGPSATNAQMRMFLIYLVLLVAAACLNIADWFLGGVGSENLNKVVRLLMFFIMGGVFYLRGSIQAPTGAPLLVGALMLVLVGGALSAPWLYVFPLAYMIITIGSKKCARWAVWSAKSDYSYGIYIYAFPVQQTVISLLGPMTSPARFLEVLVLSVLATVGLAMASFRLIESPALSLKSLAK